jgi:ribosomal protein L7Ae-like RNA K-turn-binding protein
MGHGESAAARIPPGFVVGAKAVLRAARAASPMRSVIVATDAPLSATDPVRRLAAEHSYAVIETPSSAELGRRLGLTRPVAAAAVVSTGRRRDQGPNLIPRTAQGL